MRNRIVGLMVIGIAALMAFIIYSFNAAMTEIVNTSCSHGPSCPMWGTIDFQTNFSIAITALVALLGLYLVFFGQEERVVTRFKTVRKAAAQAGPVRVSKESYQGILGQLDKDERSILEKVIEAQGSVFQSDLVEKSGFPKARVTRVLDRLEGKRRGMTNVVVLKH